MRFTIYRLRLKLKVWEKTENYKMETTKDKIILGLRWGLWSLFSICILGYIWFWWMIKRLTDDMIRHNIENLYCANSITAPIRFSTDIIIPIQFISLIGLLILAVKNKEKKIPVIMGFVIFLVILVSTLCFAHWIAKDAYLLKAIWWWI